MHIESNLMTFDGLIQMLKSLNKCITTMASMIGDVERPLSATCGVLNVLVKEAI